MCVCARNPTPPSIGSVIGSLIHYTRDTFGVQEEPFEAANAIVPRITPGTSRFSLPAMCDARSR